MRAAFIGTAAGFEKQGVNDVNVQVRVSDRFCCLSRWDN